MRRIPFIKMSFLNKKNEVFLKKPLNVYNRSLYLLLDFSGLKLRVYNGRMFRVFLPSHDTSGFKIGSFFFTRRVAKGSVMHSNKKKR